MITLFMKTRNKPFHAVATFDNGVMIVKKGSVVNINQAKHIRGGEKARSFLENPEFVNSNGEVLKDCTFTSPSTAAQFVNGNCTNGYLSWRTEDGKRLKDIIRPNVK